MLNHMMALSQIRQLTRMPRYPRPWSTSVMEQDCSEPYGTPNRTTDRTTNLTMKGKREEEVSFVQKCTRKKNNTAEETHQMQCNKKRKRAGSTKSSLPTDQRRRNITIPGITALWENKRERENFRNEWYHLIPCTAVLLCIIHISGVFCILCLEQPQHLNNSQEK